MPKKPYIDAAQCLKCGICADLCPAVFQMNEELGYVVMINPQGSSEEKIQEAVNYCPAACIHWEKN